MNIILIGSDGAMGKVVTEISKELGHQVIAGLQSTEETEQPFPIATNFDDLTQVVEGLDLKPEVMIDFSTPHLTEELLAFAVAQKLPLMLATTGQTEEQAQAIQEASKSVAILDTHNTSIGVNVMQEVSKHLSKVLYPLGYDIEIIEKHHRYKKDAPSGTAKMLLDSVEEGMSESATKVYGREGIGEAREHQEVGLHAIRGGDIVGEHTIIFANNQETLEITHRAGSKELFARGAMAGAEFLINQADPDIYSMSDIF